MTRNLFYRPTVLCLFILFNLIYTRLDAQSTLWGTVANDGQYGFGTLYRTDSIGDNKIIVHHFDSIHDGATPGAIMQASNGKIYGMTAKGGHSVVVQTVGSYTNLTQGGTLFEYDPVIDSFKVLLHINATDPNFPFQFHSPSDLKLLEVSPGVLWCVFRVTTLHNAFVLRMNRYVAAYSVAGNSLSSVATLGNWYTGSNPDPQYDEIAGPMHVGSNGLVYGTTTGFSSCALTADMNLGSIFTINPSNNSFSRTKPFNCTTADGQRPWGGNLEDVSGERYGYTLFGGSSTATFPNPGYGVIFRYDPVLNTYSKVHDFQAGNSGGRPYGNLLKANNNKLYGCAGYGTPWAGQTFGTGVLYEFNPASGTYSVILDFNQNYTQGIGTFGNLWVKSSANGKLYGTSNTGIFEYDPNTSQARAAGGRFANPTNVQPTALIEVCAKPDYRNRNTSYTVCEGSFFNHNLQSSNTGTFVWKQNGNVVPSQTTAVLSFSAIGLSDAGSWVCEMHNACGTSTSSPLNLVVNSSSGTLPASTITIAGSTTICPNSSVILSGNAGGTWNNGSTASSIAISQPGNYQVVTSTTCGSVFSNILHIDTLAKPHAAPISFTPIMSYQSLYMNMCPGDSLMLTGNTNGVWNTGETSSFIYVKDTAPHFVVSTNSCHTVYSQTAQAFYLQIPRTPTVFTAGSYSICAGDSLLLETDSTMSLEWYRMYNGTPLFIGMGNDFYVKQTGDYLCRIFTVCGPKYSNTVHVDASTVPVPTPTITISGSLTICPGDSVILSNNGLSPSWSGGQTTPSITVTQAGDYWVTNSNFCSSASSSTVQVSFSSTVSATYVETQSNVCVGTNAFSLSPGSPAGGTYSGTGVSGNVFTPSLAGPGSHTITYQYQDPQSGCNSKATQNIIVDGNPTLTAIGSTTFCSGGAVTMFQLSTPTASWNTGGTAIVNSFSVSGSYYLTKLNACNQLANSNTIQVVVNPSPTLSVNVPSLCPGVNAVLTASGASTYTWSHGVNDGVPFSPIAATIYSVTGADANGCKNTATTSVVIYPSPVISVNSGSICSGNSFTLIPSGASNYTISGNSNIVSPLTNTSYTVTGISAEGCLAQNTAVSDVTVQLSPTLSVNSGSICSGSSFTIVPSGANTYSYSGNSNVVSPLVNTNYTITGSSTEGCAAIAPAISSVVVHITPIISVNSGSVCSGNSFTINPSGADTYTVSGNSTIVTPLTSTDYTVTGSSLQGCIASNNAISSVTVYTSPTISVNSGSICSGQSFTINPSGASSYTISGNMTVVSPVVNSTYTLSGNSAEGCPSTNTAISSVTVYVSPGITVNSGSVCAGESFTLFASGAATYTFETGSNIVTPLSSTIYTVTGTSVNGCLSQSAASASVNVNSLPTLNISSSDDLLCIGESAVLTASGAQQYSWTGGPALPVYTVTPATNTSYTLMGTDGNGCSNSITFEQNVTNCTGLLQEHMRSGSIRVFPNPTEGLFTITGLTTETHITLYNNLGQLIESFITSKDQLQIDIRKYTAGMYLLRLATGSAVTMKEMRVVKD